MGNMIDDVKMEGGQTLRELDYVRNEVGELSKCIEVLSKKLTVILVPTKPCDDGQKAADYESTTTLASIIHRITNDLKIANRKLADIADRVDI